MALVVQNGFMRDRKDAALLPVRAALGGTMIYHGLSKLKEPEGHGPKRLLRKVRPTPVLRAIKLVK